MKVLKTYNLIIDDEDCENGCITAVLTDVIGIKKDYWPEHKRIGVLTVREIETDLYLIIIERATSVSLTLEYKNSTTRDAKYEEYKKQLMKQF